MTVAIYQDTPNGKLRIGTLTPRKGRSIRSMSHEFMARHPEANPTELFIAKRIWVDGKYVDDIAGMFAFDLT